MLRSLLALGALALGAALAPVRAADPVKHAFLATGGETFITGADGKATWKYAHPARDGWVLGSGNVLLALARSKQYPGGAVVEVDRDGKLVFEFKGSQAEVTPFSRSTAAPCSSPRPATSRASSK